MKNITLSGNEYFVEIEVNKNNVCLLGGHFNDVLIKKSPLFYSRIKKAGAKSEESFSIDSCSDFENVTVTENKSNISLLLENSKQAPGVSYIIDIFKCDDGLEFKTRVENKSKVLSVMETTYPVPTISAQEYDVFEPKTCGRVIKNAGQKNHTSSHFGPGKHSMQYFAVYTKKGGIYLGVHDERCSQKRFDVNCEGDIAHILPWHYGIGGNTAGNSHELPATIKWQAFSGDWYDASLIYAEFVKTKAVWTAKYDKTGRCDTPDKFKDAVVWISDYIPNSESQGDNKPMSLSAGSDIYDRDYWIKAVIELQKELGVPLCYHVYNWHEIPFNIDYPHFMPAKQEFIDGMKELQKHDIYVMPYINARSWEQYDGEDGYEVNFENTGKNGAVITEDGDYHTVIYPQMKNSGKKAYLVSMCGKEKKWQDIIEKLTRDIEDLGVDGVYFDQIGATGFAPCYGENHGHIPGDCAAVSDGYRELMKKIMENKPKDMYYFTEDTSEIYMDCFDGFLSWLWIQNGDVPAFPAIYSGQVQTIGRITIGAKKDNFDYFKYFMAKCLLYGQQIGWCKADILYDKKALAYFKSLVDIRYKYRDIFNAGHLLRPPVIETSQEDIVTPNMIFKEDVYMEQALAGAWTDFDKNKKIILAINVSENSADINMKFKYAEYGLTKDEVQKQFETDGEWAKFTGTMNPTEIKVWTF